MNPADYYGFLRKNEGCTDYPYADKRGLVTVGIGNLVASPVDMCLHPWFHKATGLAAADAEKMQAWRDVQSAFDPEHIKLASAYEDETDLRLPFEYVNGLVSDRLEHEFFPALARLFPGIEGFPQPAKNGLVDLIYSIGVNGFGPRKWPSLVAACNAIPANWAGVMPDGLSLDPHSAAMQCHRDGGSEARNAWTKVQFVTAAYIVRNGPPVVS